MGGELLVPLLNRLFGPLLDWDDPSQSALGTKLAHKAPPFLDFFAGGKGS